MRVSTGNTGESIDSSAACADRELPDGGDGLQHRGASAWLLLARHDEQPCRAQLQRQSGNEHHQPGVVLVVQRTEVPQAQHVEVRGVEHMAAPHPDCCDDHHRQTAQPAVDADNPAMGNAGATRQQLRPEHQPGEQQKQADRAGKEGVGERGVEHAGQIHSQGQNDEHRRCDPGVEHPEAPPTLPWCAPLRAYLRRKSDQEQRRHDLTQGHQGDGVARHRGQRVVQSPGAKQRQRAADRKDHHPPPWPAPAPSGQAVARQRQAGQYEPSRPCRERPSACHPRSRTVRKSSASQEGSVSCP